MMVRQLNEGYNVDTIHPFLGVSVGLQKTSHLLFKWNERDAKHFLTAHQYHVRDIVTDLRRHLEVDIVFYSLILLPLCFKWWYMCFKSLYNTVEAIHMNTIITCV